MDHSAMLGTYVFLACIFSGSNASRPSVLNMFLPVSTPGPEFPTTTTPTTTAAATTTASTTTSSILGDHVGSHSATNDLIVGSDMIPGITPSSESTRPIPRPTSTVQPSTTASILLPPAVPYTTTNTPTSTTAKTTTTPAFIPHRIAISFPPLIASVTNSPVTTDVSIVPETNGLTFQTTSSIPFINQDITTSNSTSTTPTSTTPDTLNDMDQMKSLYEALFNEYDTRIRPLEDQNQSLAITSSFVPLTVIELNTQAQVLSVQGYFKFHWSDELLKWDRDAYGVGNMVRIPIKSMWIPHIKISKELYSTGSVGNRDTDIALVHYKGAVMWWPEGIYRTVCLMDITFYPYDRQRCSFTYYVDDEDASTVYLELLRQDVKMNEYAENAEWKMINVSHELRLVDNVYYIDYHFTLERRSEFATFTLVVPAIAISLLCVSSFLVPIDSGEKGGVSMTVFLACSVYMTILVDLLPHNSLTQSHFLLYITILLFVSVFLILYTIVQARLLHVFGGETHVKTTFCQGSRPVGFTLMGILKWIDNALCVVSSITLLCSYCVLIIAMTE